ncbi:replication initiation protein [Lysinibacillus sp. S2017]|uniref:replication initiation protein n=1 Tax=Lysinibacillus sp. S2017 TaxID=2561923 RepID=UPI0010919B6E|nr:replication initiation protein [Lysinibacillus sp. S2017]TGN30376.1 RepB family plasmid replication initiator protein [Lysinibacillus sp. S2017]
MVERQVKVNSKTVVKKSTVLARTPMKLIELNKGLNLRQQRFFNMAIFAVDENGISEFGKEEYNAIFKDDSDKFYSVDVRGDVQALGSLGMQANTEREVIWRSVFIEVRYTRDTGTYKFIWSPLMKDHVKKVKQSYIQQDLQVLALFKNKYSFIWYDFFKSNYHQWKWKISKDEVINLLRLENKKSYLEKHAMLYKQCIETPLKELNDFTEYHITCEVIKAGRTVVGYEFKRYQEKGIEYTVTQKQVDVLQEIVDRYGDMEMIVREISKLSVTDADAMPYLTNLLFEIKNYKRYMQNTDSFTSESFKEVVALAIQKDNAFKAKIRELYKKKSDIPTIDDFLPEEPAKKKVPFYNWLEERE